MTFHVHTKRLPTRPGWTLIVVVLAAPILSMVMYAGPYRWLVRSQLTLFDAYAPIWTLIGLEIAALCITAVSFNLWPGVMLRPVGKADGISPPVRLINCLAEFQPRDWAIIVALMFAGTGGFFLYEDLSTGPLTPHSMADFAVGKVPETRYVELYAVPRIERISARETGGRVSPGVVYAIVPLSAPGWKPDRPIYVFLETFAGWLPELRRFYNPPEDRHAQLMEENKFALAGMRHLHDEQGRALVRLRGRTTRNGLSSVVEEAFEDSGLRLGDPYYVIDQTWSPGEGTSLAVALMGAPLGIALLAAIVVIPASLWRSRYRPRDDDR